MAQMTTMKAEPETRQAHKLSLILSEGFTRHGLSGFHAGELLAAAMGMEVHIFFTFWGMAVINKNRVANLCLGPDASPGDDHSDDEGCYKAVEGPNDSRDDSRCARDGRSLSRMLHDHGVDGDEEGRSCLRGR